MIDKLEDIDNFFYLVKLHYINEIEVSKTNVPVLSSDDWVVAETRYGVDMVRVLGKATESNKNSNRHVGRILRLANENDFLDQENSYQLEESYSKICKERVFFYGLNMKIIAVHVLLLRSKILIFFTSDQRVDFRELVRDLVSQFHTRIELRQVGVRDETRTLGGLAICGREYCCSSVGDHIKPATIKMVKDQELSLNSSKISGGCGRLLCCLSYEHEYYVESKDSLPELESKVWITGIDYKVINSHMLTHEVSLMNCQDAAAKPLRISAKNLYYDEQKKAWYEGKSVSKKMVQTSCGCTKKEGTRCQGCSAKG